MTFTGSDLRLIPAALAHARRGSRIMATNMALALLIIVVLCPLALTGVLGLAAVVLVHESAEVVVITNGLRAARASRRCPGQLPGPDHVPQHRDGLCHALQVRVEHDDRLPAVDPTTTTGCQILRTTAASIATHPAINCTSPVRYDYFVPVRKKR